MGKTNFRETHSGGCLLHSFFKSRVTEIFPRMKFYTYMRSFVIFFYMFVLKLLKACVEWKKRGNFSRWEERYNFSPGQSCREAIFLESFILRRIFLIIPIKALLCVCYMNDEDCSLQYQFFHLHWNLTNKEPIKNYMTIISYRQTM